MKKIFTCLLPAMLIACALQAGIYGDTTIRGVDIRFTYHRNIFPGSWLVAEVNARGEAMDPSGITRIKQIMAKALAKYPAELLRVNLRAAYFLKRMSMYGVEFGGTNSMDAVYLTNSGKAQVDTDIYIEQTFHHEFSSILFRNYPLLLDTVAWKAVNIPSAGYTDPEAGVAAIRKNQSSQELDTALCRMGFLTQYAYSDMENDINSIAQNLFKPSTGFWDIVNNYPRIKEKVRLLIAFYAKLDPAFNQQFFIKMNKDSL